MSQNRKNYDAELGIHYPKLPLLTKNEEIALSRLVKRGDIDARNKLVLHNVRLAISVALTYNHRLISGRDLIQEGIYSLFDAAVDFNPDMGNRFSTFATRRIRAAVVRAMENQGRVIRLPNDLFVIQRKVDEYVLECEELDREVAPEQLAEICGCSVSMLDSARFMHDAFSLDYHATHGFVEEASIADTIEQSSEPDPFEYACAVLRREGIGQFLSVLDERDQEIVRMRLFDEKTLQEIADVFFVTRECIRQHMVKSLKRLRNVSGRLKEVL